MADKLDNEFQNIAKSMEDISKSTNDIRIKIRKDLIDSVKELSDVTKEYNDDLKTQETSWGRLLTSNKDYSKQIEKANKTAEEAEKRKTNLAKKLDELYRKRARAQDGIINLTAVQKKQLRDQIRDTKEQYQNLGKTVTNAKGLANTLTTAANKSKSLGQNIKSLLSENFGKFVEALSFKSLVQELGASNKQTVELAKTLGTSVGNAADLKFEFSKVASVTSKASINTKNLAQSYLELSRTFGAVAGYSSDQVVAQTELTKLVGLTAVESSKIVGLGILNNKNNKQVTSEILDQVNALEKETGIRIDGRALLREVANINGQLAAQYQFNNKLLAEAVVKVKQFGLNLKDAEGIANNLLEFQSSIGNELEAELLTGKSLNLERARSLALAGKTAEAASEVAKQFGSAEEFTSMNVLQQRSLAKAVGLTADQLANSIREREILRSLGAENIEQLRKEGRLNELNATETGRQLYQSYQQQSLNEKFQESLTKIKGLVVSIVEAFTPIIEIIASALDSTIVMGSILGAMAGVTLVKMISSFRALYGLVKLIKIESIGAAIASIFQGQGKIPIAGIALAGATVGAMFAAISSVSKADDMMYGNNMLITKNKGAIALNNDDTIIAGTNLGGGSGRSSGISDEQIGKLASAINSKEVRFDSYSASGPQGIINTERRQASNLFA